MAYEWFLEQGRIGNLFRAANQAAATVTLINTSTATGLILGNPFGSGKKLVIRDVNFTYTTVPTATAKRPTQRACACILAQRRSLWRTDR